MIGLVLNKNFSFLSKIFKKWNKYSLTLLSIVLALICAVEELSIEELDTNHSKDELKKDVDDKNIENIL